jgi:Glutathione S-transferase, N-terminal domain
MPANPDDTWLVTRLLTLLGTSREMITNRVPSSYKAGLTFRSPIPYLRIPSHSTDLHPVAVFDNPISNQMVLKLYTASLSTCGRRVAVILHEKKVPYELIQGNWAAKEHKSEAWTKNQPFGQMPYIDVSIAHVTSSSSLEPFINLFVSSRY